MKRIHFFVLALIVMMGVSFTSCINGDNDTVYRAPALGKCLNYFPPTFQLSSGQKVVLTDASLSTVDLNIGEIYFFYYQFDTATQAADAEKINATLLEGSTPVSISAHYAEGPENLDESSQANAPLYVLTGNVDNGRVEPEVAFDNGYLLVPVVYWVKQESTEDKQKEEIKKHSFVLTYDEKSIKSGDTELVLTLNHVINDGTEKDVVRGRYTSTYKAYNLSSALNIFKEAAGSEPTKIIVKAQTNSRGNSLKDNEGATEQEWEYTIK